jgi:hypothetical protein
LDQDKTQENLKNDQDEDAEGEERRGGRAFFAMEYLLQHHVLLNEQEVEEQRQGWLLVQRDCFVCGGCDRDPRIAFWLETTEQRAE